MKPIVVLFWFTIATFYNCSAQKKYDPLECAHGHICCQVSCPCCPNEELPKTIVHIKSPDVEYYIDQLKKGTYTASELPNFSHQHIPSLLAYRNDTVKIENFPINGYSSYSQSECKLGMYVLWTIESIRAVSIESEGLIGRFPSQNPIVQKRGGAFEEAKEEEVQAIVSKAYFDWWKANEKKTFDAISHIDPLEETQFQWH